MGHFQYAENKYQGFALVHITDKEFTIQYKGVPKPKLSLSSLIGINSKAQILDLFEVKI